MEEAGCKAGVADFLDDGVGGRGGGGLKVGGYVDCWDCERHFGLLFGFA